MISENGRPMLDKAREIKEALIEVESSVEAVSHGTLLEVIRERFGYEGAGPAESDGLVNVRIDGPEIPVITPESLTAVLPSSTQSAETTRQSRESVTRILKGDDDRLIAIVGPCSIHDPEAALEYALMLKQWRENFSENLEIIMRAYMEKPRTEIGWKGLVYDPELDESNDINLGIVVVRMLACRITHLGVPIAMERLNANTPQYVNGLVAYDAIGARNTTDQKAREYASGTSSPVGFKNTPEGSILAAAQAVASANAPHTFLGTNMAGILSQLRTLGNDTAHIILRGNERGPNYRKQNVIRTAKILRKKGLLGAIIIDASHGNSGKEAANQNGVIKTVSSQVAEGQPVIKGVMIESNLKGGAQSHTPGKGDPSKLEYGLSITDKCSPPGETVEMLEILSRAVVRRRERLETSSGNFAQARKK